jgi:hypothetical protein
MPGQIIRSATFGGYLKHLRITTLGDHSSYKNVQEALAARGIAPVSGNTIFRYEMEGRVPDVLTLVALADLYRVDPTVLFAECMKDLKGLWAETPAQLRPQPVAQKAKTKIKKKTLRQPKLVPVHRGPLHAATSHKQRTAAHSPRTTRLSAEDLTPEVRVAIEALAGALARGSRPALPQTASAGRKAARARGARNSR